MIEVSSDGGALALTPPAPPPQPTAAPVVAPVAAPAVQASPAPAPVDVPPDHRGLPQPGDLPGSTGPIVAPHPQPPPTAPPTVTPPVTPPGGGTPPVVDVPPDHRGLPQPGDVKGDTGSIVEPHPQPKPGGDEPPVVEPPGPGGGGDRTTQGLDGSGALAGAAFARQLFMSCELYGCDLAAAAAIGEQRGSDGTVADQGEGYGPWGLHLTDGRLAAFTGRPPFNTQVQLWSWSQAGIDYAVRQMVKAAGKGTTGHAAVAALAHKFQPQANPAGEQKAATANYDRLAALSPAALRAAIAHAFGGPTGLQAGGGGGVPAVTATGPQTASRSFAALLRTCSRDLAHQAQHTIEVAGLLVGAARA